MRPAKKCMIASVPHHLIPSSPVLRGCVPAVYKLHRIPGPTSLLLLFETGQRFKTRWHQAAGLDAAILQMHGWAAGGALQQVPGQVAEVQLRLGQVAGAVAQANQDTQNLRAVVDAALLQQLNMQPPPPQQQPQPQQQQQP